MDDDEDENQKRLCEKPTSHYISVVLLFVTHSPECMTNSLWVIKQCKYFAAHCETLYIGLVKTRKKMKRY